MNYDTWKTEPPTNLATCFLCQRPADSGEQGHDDRFLCYRCLEEGFSFDNTCCDTCGHIMEPGERSYPYVCVEAQAFLCPRCIVDAEWMLRSGLLKRTP